jgi:hypothetical protein
MSGQVISGLLAAITILKTNRPVPAGAAADSSENAVVPIQCRHGINRTETRIMIIALLVMASLIAYMFFIYDHGKHSDSRVDGSLWSN